jgi:hypothetical protein
MWNTAQTEALGARVDRVAVSGRRLRGREARLAEERRKRRVSGVWALRQRPGRRGVKARSLTRSAGVDAKPNRARKGALGALAALVRDKNGPENKITRRRVLTSTPAAAPTRRRERQRRPETIRQNSENSSRYRDDGRVARLAWNARAGWRRRSCSRRGWRRRDAVRQICRRYRL